MPATAPAGGPEIPSESAARTPKTIATLFAPRIEGQWPVERGGVLRRVLAAVRLLVPSAPHDSFVTRSGSHLEVAGRPFRFGGANVEWLGLVGYGPFDPSGPRYPSHFEIDDALATAQEMGARVVR